MDNRSKERWKANLRKLKKQLEKELARKDISATERIRVRTLINSITKVEDELILEATIRYKREKEGDPSTKTNTENLDNLVKEVDGIVKSIDPGNLNAYSQFTLPKYSSENPVLAIAVIVGYLFDRYNKRKKLV